MRNCDYVLLTHAARRFVTVATQLCQIEPKTVRLQPNTFPHQASPILSALDQGALSLRLVSSSASSVACTLGSYHPVVVSVSLRFGGFDISMADSGSSFPPCKLAHPLSLRFGCPIVPVRQLSRAPKPHDLPAEESLVQVFRCLPSINVAELRLVCCVPVNAMGTFVGAPDDTIL